MHLGATSRGPIGAILCLLALAPLVLGPFGAFARVYPEVEVRGAVLTSEQDIRLACGVEAGADYEAEDLRDIEACILDSDLFASARAAAEGDRLVVTVQEKELRPGRLEFGLAYDSQDGVVGTAYLERYNLFPKTFGALELRLGAQAQGAETSLYRAGGAPGLFDFGLDAGYLATRYDDQAFHMRRTRAEVFVARADPTWGRFEAGLGWRSDREFGFSDRAGSVLRSEGGTVSAPFLRLRYALRATPEADFPAPGHALTLDQYFWNIGDARAVADSRLRAETGFVVAPKTLLSLDLSAGAITSLGGAGARAIDRYQLGGAEFRGFAPRGLGPKQGDDFLGGKYFALANVAVDRAIGEVFRAPARAGLFASVGALWGLDGAPRDVFDGRKMRASIGASLTFDVIAGAPLSLYLARATAHEKGDDLQSFGLSFATRF